MNFRQKPAIPANAADSTVRRIALPEHTALQPADHEPFFAGLDTPTAATEKLRMAFARYHETINSR